MGSVFENLHDATAKEPVEGISLKPAESAAPKAQEPQIHPDLAACIAARYTPKQEAWREDRPVKVSPLSLALALLSGTRRREIFAKAS